MKHFVFLSLAVVACCIINIAYAQVGAAVVPSGFLDSANTTHATGWSCDLTAANQPVTIHLYIDGTQAAVFQATLTREAAVGGVCAGFVNHGFVYAFTAAQVSLLGDGNTHSVSAFAEDIPSGTQVQLSHSPISVVNQLPHGFLDLANSTLVTGWACDADVPEASIGVAVYVDSTFVGTATANIVREQAVASACGSTSSAHGYAFYFPSAVSTFLANGSPHQVIVRAINVPQGLNPQLTNSPMTVQLPTSTDAPKGHLDSVTATTAAGWACDPNDFSKGIFVRLFIDGQFTAEIAAKRSRPDVASVCGGVAAHGFSFNWQGTLPKFLANGRPHTITAFAVDVPTGKNVPLAGSPFILQV